MSDESQQRPPTIQRFLNIFEWTVAIGLTLTLIVFHVLRATYAGALWRDEWSTVAVAEQPTLKSLYNQLAFESFPALTGLALNAWRFTGSGGSQAGLRTFGMLVGLSIVAILWRNSWRFGRSPPLLSLALFAFSPVVIQWGDSVRAYGLGTLLAMLTLRLLWEFVSAPRRGMALAAGIAAVLSVQCLYQNSFLLLAGCIGAVTVAVLRRRWKVAGIVIAIGIIAAASLLPYLPILAKIHDLQELVAAPMRDPPVWEKLLAMLSQSGDLMPWAWAIAITLTLAIAAIPFTLPSGRHMEPSRRDLSLFAAIVLVSGQAAFWVYLHTLQFDINIWYFVPIMGFAATCLDASLGALHRPAIVEPPSSIPYDLRRICTGATAVAVALTACVACLTLESCWRRIHERQTNLDDVARILENHATDGDVILVIPNVFAASFYREYKRHDPILTLPQQNDLSFQRLDHVRTAMASAHPIDKTLDRLATALRDGHRVYIFAYLLSAPASRPSPVLPPAPRKETGWYMVPYLVSWELQTSRFLQIHALHISSLKVPNNGPINDKEFVQQILVIDGWKAETK